MGGGTSKAKKVEENYKPDVASAPPQHDPQPATETKLMNSAFLFLKPHANNPKTQQLVAAALQQNGINVVKEGEFSGPQIDEGKLIDRHYYAIASKATLLPAKDIPVPAEKFQEAFGVSWETVLQENRAFNAVDAQRELGVDVAGLNTLWLQTSLVKFGGGFYCGEIKRESGPSIFTFNAFFMTMRGKFVAPDASIHYYVVEFDPDKLSWKDFRGSVLGPTDCSKAPETSLRGKMFREWQSLDLKAEPNVSDNCVHASASPLEGLGERMNWLKVDIDSDSFGAAAVKAGVAKTTLESWVLDPQVNGKSVFDQLEDKNTSECLDVMVKLNAA
jgi:hypothetical protein